MAADSYYYADDNKKPVGPYSLGQLQDLASRGIIGPNTKVIAKGGKSWMAYAQLPLAPVATPPVAAPTSLPSSSEEGGSFLSGIPKPIFFGLLGAVGCLIGWLLGEPVLMTLKESESSQGTRVDGNQTASQNQASVLVFRPEMPKPVFRPAIQKRLEKAGAHDGAIEIALLWNKYDDLDLHCIDPSGSHIYFGNERSPSGGWLDVDMNAGGQRSLEPVEHIRWPEGKAPEGEYQVSVKLYSSRSGTNILFTVAIKANNEIKEFKMPTQGQGQQVPVHTFRIEATNIVVATNAPLATLMIPVNTPPPSPSLKSALIMGIWTALLAIFISLLLVMGQNYYTRRPLISAKTVGVILAGGTLAGLLSGITSQYLFSLAANAIMVKFPDLGWLLKAGLVVGWMLLGGLLGAGMGWFIPNLPKIRAGFSGVIGGFIGALAFLLTLTVSSELVGRMAGTFILGFAIGLMVALVEQLTRKAWLTVFWTENQHSNINLGAKPVTIGGGTEDIRIKGLGENTLSILLIDGRILCTQQPGNKETELKDQSVLNLGRTRLVVHAQKEG